MRNGEIVGEKGDGKIGIGVNSADFRGSSDDCVRPVFLQPGLDVGLAGQIEAAPVGGQDFAALGVKPAQKRGADHAAMAANPDALALDRKMFAAHRRSPGGC